MNARRVGFGLIALLMVPPPLAAPETLEVSVSLTAQAALHDAAAHLPVDLEAVRDVLGVDLAAGDWSARVVREGGDEPTVSQTTFERRPDGSAARAHVMWLVPGEHEEGAKLGYRVTLGAEAPRAEAESPIEVERTGAEVIVRTPHFTAHHDLNAGGLLGTVEFADGGTLPMRMNDRLWHEGRGGFNLTNDGEPRVEVVAEGPLTAVVRTTARYCGPDGRPAPGEAEATYEFAYSALSPTVRMKAIVAQHGGPDWDQVHAFEMYHKTEEPFFDTVAWSPPLESVEFVDEHNTHSLRGRDWGALLTRDVAVALIGSDLYGIHTGLSGHGVYVHGPWHTFRGGEVTFEATLYLGPSGGSAEALAERLEGLSAGWGVSVFLPELREPIDRLRRDLHEKRDLMGGLHGERGRRTAPQRKGEPDELMAWLEDVGDWLLDAAERASTSLNGLRDWDASISATGSVLRRMELLLHLAPEGTPNRSPLIHLDDEVCVLAGDGLVLRLARGEHRMRLAQIGRFGDASASFLAPGADAGELWSLTFRRGPTGEESGVSPDGAEAIDWAVEAPGDEALLRLIWSGCDVGERAGALDVEVAVRLDRRSSLSDWSLSWANRAEDLGIWEIDFPRLGAIGPGGQVCVPYKWGRVYDVPLQGSGYRSRYPSGGAFAQMMCYWRDGAGLYYAAHDPEAGVKEPRAQTDTGGTLALGLTTFPVGMGVPAPTGELGYEVAVGAFDGDWFDAAKIYRAWATRQFWTRKGPIAEREDMAQWWKDCSLCIRPNGDPDFVTEMGTSLQAAFDMPAVLHWYVWHQIPFDNNYPEYFPVKPGFGEAVQALQDVGVHVMPYVNGHLWDTDTQSWEDENGYSGAALRPDGSLYIEGWQQQEHAAMCPASEKWQSKMLDVATRLADDYGCDGIYLDQIGAAAPRLCFSEEHGHPVGGGGFWARGYDELLARMRESCRAVNPDFIMTTESHAEPYMAGLDGHLMCNNVGADQVPLYSAIYAGYTQTFGRQGEVENPVAFRMEHGQAFVFGSMMGRINSTLLLEPENAELLAYLKSLAEIRRDFRDFLAFGEMLRPPELAADIPPVTTQWLSKTSDVVTMAAIQCSAWRARDGRVGLFYTNVAEEPVSFTHTFSLSDYGVPSGADLEVRLRTFNAPDGAEPELETGGAGSFTVSHTMQSMETMVVVVE